MLCSFPLRVPSAADSFNIEPTPPRPKKPCNESRLQWEVEVCGEDFKRDMGHIDPQNWCNLTHFIRYDHRTLYKLCLNNSFVNVKDPGGRNRTGGDRSGGFNRNIQIELQWDMLLDNETSWFVLGDKTTWIGTQNIVVWVKISTLP